MPRATCKYPFEWKVFHWAKGLSTALAGHCHYAFFVVLTEAGQTRKIVFGDEPERFDRDELVALQQEAPSWLFHDPFEGPMYTHIGWKNVERRTMERLLGTRFEASDLAAADGSIDFPSSWAVMFWQKCAPCRARRRRTLGTRQIASAGTAGFTPVILTAPLRRGRAGAALSPEKPPSLRDDPGASLVLPHMSSGRSPKMACPRSSSPPACPIPWHRCIQQAVTHSRGAGVTPAAIADRQAKSTPSEMVGVARSPLPGTIRRQVTPIATSPGSVRASSCACLKVRGRREPVFSCEKALFAPASATGYIPAVDGARASNRCGLVYWGGAA